MNVLTVPFVKKLGIQRADSGNLYLPFDEGVRNHIDTFHASAQFALAETASGDCLQSLFPELAGKVIPVLRDAQVKFRKPAMMDIEAHASVSEEVRARFREQLANKGRASIRVDVEVKDRDGTLTLSGEYNWFVQNLEQA